MAESAQTPVDGFVSLLGGMHAGIEPEVLGETAYSRGVNVTSRGGLLRTRPGFTPDVQLPSGVFQGMAPWALHSGHKLVVVVRGGVSVYDVDTGSLTTFTRFQTKLDQSARCYFCQAERFFIIQDGLNTPVVLEEVERDVEGVSVKVIERRTTPHTIPVGTVMTFVHGRLHITPTHIPGTLENGRPYVLSGDVFQAQNPSACLEFTETEYLNGGGAHGLPMEMGYVQAFAPLKNASTGTGYGGTVVFAERGVSAFDFSVPRDEWNSTALAQVLYFGPGTKSPWSVVPINGTLLYRAQDGLRILSYAVSAAQSTGDTLSMVPQSPEVSPFMTRDDREYLPYVSAAVSGNRAFVTVGGTNARWFKALVVLDAARISQMSSVASETAYDGIWQIEGRTIGGVAACTRDSEDAIYVFCDDNKLWRLDESATTDNGAAIRSRLVTRALLMSSPDLKKLSSIQFWLKNLAADTTVTAYYRPIGYPLWGSFGSRTVRVGASSLAQHRRALTIGLDHASAPCDPAGNESIYLGQGFQFCLEFSASCVVEMFRCLGSFAHEPSGDPCDETTGVDVAAGEAGVEIGEYL